jgi:sec-independent protein translocase protein TatC
MADASPPDTERRPGIQGDGSAAPGESDSDPVMEAGNMSLLDHLEDLRWTIIKGCSGFVAGIIASVVLRQWIINDVLIGPTRTDFFMYGVLGIDAKELHLLNRTITGQFFADIGTLIVVGVILGSPVFVYFVWKFIEPALYPEERGGMRFAAVFAALFFFMGVSFGYLILTPLALQFFASYELSAQIENQFDIMTYFSMVTFWAFGSGLLFEMPVVMYFLGKVGLITPHFMRTHRKYALLTVLVIGAFLTPPDPISQLIVALPLLLLYEFSILVVAWVTKKRRRELGMSDA